jgi:hypothetical protein
MDMAGENRIYHLTFEGFVFSYQIPHQQEKILNRAPSVNYDIINSISGQYWVLWIILGDLYCKVGGNQSSRGNWSPWRHRSPWKHQSLWSLWRQLESMERNWNPWRHRNLWSQLQRMETTGAPGDNRSPWRQMEPLEETRAPL